MTTSKIWAAAALGAEPAEAVVELFADHVAAATAPPNGVMIGPVSGPTRILPPEATP